MVSGSTGALSNGDDSALPFCFVWGPERFPAFGMGGDVQSAFCMSSLVKKSTSPPSVFSQGWLTGVHEGHFYMDDYIVLVGKEAYLFNSGIDFPSLMFSCRNGHCMGMLVAFID